MLHAGVYIGSDFEMVVTERYIITYRRDKKMDLLESRLYQRSNQTFLCIGICQSNPMETEKFILPLCWKTAFISNGKVICKHKVLRSIRKASLDCPLYMKI